MKNRIETGPGANEVSVELTQGKWAVVGIDDLTKISGHRWHAIKQGVKWYAATNVRDGSFRKTVTLHRFLVPGKITVDHEDGDGLTNRRYNLREATKAQPSFNRRKSTKILMTSRFIGVSRNKGRGNPWRARIGTSPRVSLGLFATEEAAARAFDEAAFLRYGKFAHLNFP